MPRLENSSSLYSSLSKVLERYEKSLGVSSSLKAKSLYKPTSEKDWTTSQILIYRMNLGIRILPREVPTAFLENVRAAKDQDNLSP